MWILTDNHMTMLTSFVCQFLVFSLSQVLELQGNRQEDHQTAGTVREVSCEHKHSYLSLIPEFLDKIRYWYLGIKKFLCENL